MKEKLVIEVDVPEGKQAIWENGEIKFINKEPHWKSITTFDKALLYVKNNLPECIDLIKSYNTIIPDSYESYIISYRIVVAALTNNEERSLSLGERWYPVVEFCSSEGKWHSNGKKIIGTIVDNSRKERFLVFAGKTYHGTSNNNPSGLGGFASVQGISCCNTNMGIRSVSSKEIANHISTYFGKLLFNMQYRGNNCKWEWEEKYNFY